MNLVHVPNQYDLGLIPDEPDSRDHLHIPDPLYQHSELPDSWSLYRHAPWPVSQGNTGACTGYAGMAFVHTLTSRMLGTNNAMKIDPLHLYEITRKRMGTFPRDSGANLRTVMQVLKEDGGIPQGRGPRRVNEESKPFDGIPFRLRDYQRLGMGDRSNIIDHIKRTLFFEKIPIAVGMAMPLEQIRGTTRRHGTLQWTGNGLYAQAIGWHAMTIVGWDRTRLMCWTSYGRDYGLHGFIWTDNEYFLYSDWVPDLWTGHNKHA